MTGPGTDEASGVTTLPDSLDGVRACDESTDFDHFIDTYLRVVQTLRTAEDVFADLNERPLTVGTTLRGVSDGT